jgi:hypothetical protein
MTNDTNILSTFDREQFTTYTFQVEAYDSPNHPNERLRSTVPVSSLLYISVVKPNNCPSELVD